jgi:hypothetical protein
MFFMVWLGYKVCD